MSQMASAIQIVLGSLTIVSSLVLAGIGVAVFLGMSRWDMIGVFAYVVVVDLYWTVFFATCRRDGGFASVKADLIMQSILAAGGIVIAVICTWVGVFPTIFLIIAVVFEGVFVGRTNLDGKWRMTLYRVCREISGERPPSVVGYRAPDLNAPHIIPFGPASGPDQAPPYDARGTNDTSFEDQAYGPSSSLVQPEIPQYADDNATATTEFPKPLPLQSGGKFGVPVNTNRPPSVEGPPPAYHNL